MGENIHLYDDGQFGLRTELHKYLNGTINGECLNYWKRKKRARRTSVQIIDRGEDGYSNFFEMKCRTRETPPEIAIRRESAGVLNECVENLPEILRNTITMKLEGKTFREMAKLRGGCSSRWQQRYAQALDKLKRNKKLRLAV